MKMEFKELLEQPAVPVPTAGKFFGLGRNASYDAARRGEIETIDFGKRKMVSTMWIRRKLGLEVAA
jgi:hypothetical protein